MEHHVRSARPTDVDAAIRILRLAGDDPEPRRDEIERLRSLLFVPSATVVVAESLRRVVGIGVLSIRPSVRSGPFVGVIDDLNVGFDAEAVGSGEGSDHAARRSDVAGSLIEQLVTSARNKGCTRVEVGDVLAGADPALWKRAGFAKQGTLLSRNVG